MSSIVPVEKRGQHSSFLIQIAQDTNLEDRQILWNS